jgi:hypothetical protein
MTDKMEVRLRELYRQYVQVSAGEKAAMEKEFFSYFLEARPLRPTRLYRDTPWRDPRFKVAYKFLTTKGYVTDPFPLFNSFRQQLKLDDFLWASEHVDSRFFQLLPAVVIRFPFHFQKIRNMPADLHNVIDKLKTGATAGPVYKEYPFKLLKSWLWFQPSDVRNHKVNGSRISVRLDPNATHELNEFCEREKLTRTEAIHMAIRKLRG